MSWKNEDRLIGVHEFEEDQKAKGGGDFRKTWSFRQPQRQETSSRSTLHVTVQRSHSDRGKTSSRAWWYICICIKLQYVIRMSL